MVYGTALKIRHENQQSHPLSKKWRQCAQDYRDQRSLSMNIIWDMAAALWTSLGPVHAIFQNTTLSLALITPAVKWSFRQSTLTSWAIFPLSNGEKLIPFLDCGRRSPWDNGLALCNLSISVREDRPSLALPAKNHPGWVILNKTLFFPTVWKNIWDNILNCRILSREYNIGEGTRGEWDVHLAISENWTWRKECKRDILMAPVTSIRYMKKYKHTLFIMMAWIYTVFILPRLQSTFIYVISFIFSASLWSCKHRYNHPHVADGKKWGVEKLLLLLMTFRHKSGF